MANKNLRRLPESRFMVVAQITFRVVERGSGVKANEDTWDGPFNSRESALVVCKRRKRELKEKCAESAKYWGLK